MDDIESEDSKRHKIYFQINGQDAYSIGKLPTSEYVKLMNNDQTAHDFIWQLFKLNKIAIESGKIDTLSRSIDDVNYTPINLPAAKPSSRVPTFTMVSPCSTMSAIDKIEPQLSNTSTSESQSAMNKSIVPTKIVEKANSVSDDELHELVESNQPSTGVRSTKTSDVWQYFKKESELTARCIVCNKVLKHCGNTTNLKQHLTRRHALLCSSVGSQKRRAESSGSSNDGNQSGNNRSEVKRMRSQTKENRLCPIDEAFERVNAFADGGKTADKITNAILYMVAVDQMPFSTVENEGFKSLLKTVAPLYNIPSRKTLTKLIDSRYEVLKDHCKNDLQKADSLTLTCDVWTDVSNQSYLGLSIHYLNEELEMKNGCLGVVPLYENHTAVYLTNALNSVIADFNIDRAKIMAIVSDSGANIKKAVCDTIGKDKQLACFSHILSHLVPNVTATMPELTEIIVKVKSIVTLTRRSVVASDELRRLQIRDGKTDGTARKFIQDVPTRWNSTMYMLERFLLLEEYVYPVLLKCSSFPDMLRRYEIQILTDIVSLMKPVENVIREISGDSYPTCSIIIPIIRCMEATIQQTEPETELGVEFKNKLLTEITFRFKDFELNPILAVATILDPRFKKMHFQNALAASTAITRIQNRIKCTPTQNTTNKKKDGVDQVGQSQKSIWEFHDSLMSKNPDGSIHDESPTLELRQYLSQPLISRFENPFKHWKSLRHALPVLSKLAMQCVSIVGTSVPAERMFSRAGLIKTDNRNRLTGEHLNKLMFLSSRTREEWGMA